VFDDGTCRTDSLSSISIPSTGTFAEVWEDKKRLMCTESEKGGNCRLAEGLDAGGDVGAELGMTSSMLESS